MKTYSNQFVSFLTFSIVSLIFGLTWPFSTIGHPSLIIEMFGMENFTIGLGLTYFFRGVGCIVGPMIVGVIYDSQHSYKMAGIAAGASVVTSALFIMFIQFYLHKPRNSKKAIDQ